MISSHQFVTKFNCYTPYSTNWYLRSRPTLTGSVFAIKLSVQRKHSGQRRSRIETFNNRETVSKDRPRIERDQTVSICQLRRNGVGHARAEDRKI